MVLGDYITNVRINQWQIDITNHRHHLWSFMLFLRVTPLIPNWLMNVSAPHMGIPLITFWSSTFIGVIPQSVFAIRVGMSLERIGEGMCMRGYSSVASDHECSKCIRA